MEPTNRQLLETIRSTLTERVTPALTDPVAVKGLALVGVALGELLRRDHDGEQERERVREALEELVNRGTALVAQLGSAVGDGEAWPERPDALKPTWSPEDRIEAAWGKLASLSGGLLRARAGGNLPGDDTARVTAFLTDVLEAECAEKSRDLAPAVAATDRADAGVAVRISTLGDYLSARLSAAAGSVVQEVRQLSGGFSNSTYHVTLGTRTVTPGRW